MVTAKRHATPQAPASECPICRHRFPTGITGWYSHIGKLSNHPNWHPDVTDAGERKALFIKEFPEFFRGAWTPNRRDPSRAPGTRPSTVGAVPTMQLRFCPCCGQEWPMGLKPPEMG